MRVGICGYRGSGKSTVFAALAPGGATSRGGVALGNIKVPDRRVDRLAAIFKPKKTIYAEITFVDVGGGRADTGAFPPDVIRNMRSADVLAHVVRGFENPMLSQAADAGRDLSLLADELNLLDQQALEKICGRWKKGNRRGPEVEVAQRCLAELEAGRPLRGITLSEDDRAALTGIQLLSAKPLINLYNLSEAAWDDPDQAALRETREAGGNTLSMAICAKVEAEIAELPAQEQGEFLKGLGLSEPARNAFIQAAYRLLDLVSFLTAGPDECRAWPIRRGASAQKAAGKVHSDIERGFIRVEIYRVEDLEAAGSEAALKGAGKIRLEGKEYMVQDGDVVNYRFNV